MKDELDEALAKYEAKKILEQDYISRNDVITIVAKKYLFKDQTDFPQCVRLIAKQVKSLPVYHLNPAQWIPVTERLPEDKINPLTEDFYEYPVTVEIRGKRDVRYYKFGKPIGWDEPHWFFGSGIMDDFVIAWMPLPEPYKAESEDKE